MDTSLTLLARLGGEAADPPVWDRFVRLYSPRILEWCRHWGLQDADAEDVCQEVLIRVARQMRTFEYQRGKSFRAWLKTVTKRAWIDWQEAGRKPGRGTGDSDNQSALESVEAREDLVARLEADFDRELLEAAADRVKRRVDPTTWEAFRLTAVEGLSGADAAARLGLKVANVFVAKGRVQKLLSEEVRALERDE
ncbi:MAG: sigma-70 family RNA polymerase sigma factor [Isosphaeraceae bacterium]